MKNEKLLEIKDLNVEYRTDDATYYAVNDLSLSLDKGETLGLVGETGAGKTTTALSILRLLPKNIGFITKGEIKFNGKDLLKATEDELRDIRGKDIAMIFQDPMTSLNPVFTVGNQIEEVIAKHETNLSKKEIDDRVDALFELVGIPAERKTEFPHQFSGGMKQRVVIAMALACQPKLLLADEPTTALDVTIQAQVLSMMSDLKTRLNTSMILITHDLGVVAEICDHVAVMYAGQIIENGTAEDIYETDKHHPYTVGLFGSIPDIESKAKRLTPIDGLMPDPSDLPKGCNFSPRCPKCMDICREKEPPTIRISDTHTIKCHLFDEKY